MTETGKEDERNTKVKGSDSENPVITSPRHTSKNRKERNEKNEIPEDTKSRRKELRSLMRKKNNDADNEDHDDNKEKLSQSGPEDENDDTTKNEKLNKSSKRRIRKKESAKESSDEEEKNNEQKKKSNEESERKNSHEDAKALQKEPTLGIVERMGKSMASSITNVLVTTKLVKLVGGSLAPLPKKDKIEEACEYKKLKHMDDYVTKIKVKFTGDIPEDPNIIHPVIKVHIVDVTSGQYIKKKSKVPSVNFNENITIVDYLPNSDKARSSDMSTYVLPIMTQPAILGRENQGASIWNEELNINIPYKNIYSPTTMILFELLDFGPRVPKDNEYCNSGFYSIAWGFLRPLGLKGKSNIATEADENERSVNICLYKYQKIPFVAEVQARNLGLFRADPPVPYVFIQYQMNNKVEYPSSLHLSVSPDLKREETEVRKRPFHATEVERHVMSLKDIKESLEAVDPITTHKVESNTTIPSMPTLRCERYESEPCLIPHRLIHRLPSGSEGCQRVQFSQSGKYLAAACIHNNNYPVKVFDVDTGQVRFKLLGHRAIVYSISWSDDDSEILSTSSDGRAIIWKTGLYYSTESQHDKSKRSHGLKLTLLHQPPYYVYCGEFHHSLRDIGFTGAYDCHIRMWNTSSGNLLGYLGGKKPTHSGTVNCLQHERSTGKFYSGDSTGVIIVWKPSSNGNKPDEYEAVKTIRHPDILGNCITSMCLHPRKSHLLAQAKGDCLRYFELRSYLLLNKGYSGIKCFNEFIKSTFSPDGRFIVSGSEDGAANLFYSHNAQKLSGGPWGQLYKSSLIDCSWSRQAHLVALCSSGENAPIFILGAERGDENNTNKIIEEYSALSKMEQEEKEERKKRITERRRQRRESRLETESNGDVVV